MFRRFRRKGFRRRYRKTVGRKTYKTVKKIVRKAIDRGNELKYKDTEFQPLVAEDPFYDITQSGTLSLLNVVQQGTASTQRVGVRIKSKFLYIKGILETRPLGYDGATVSPYYANTIRVMVVYYRNKNGVLTLNPADILEHTGTPYVVNAFKQWNLNRNWDIWYDKKFNLISRPELTNDGVGGVGSINRRNITIRIPRKKLIQYGYQGTDGDLVNNPMDGSLYLLMFSDIPDEDPNAPLFTGSSRFYFTDM